MSIAKAVILGSDGHERVILVSDPPPPTLRLPVSQPWSLAEPTDQCSRINYVYREFRLQRGMQSPTHKWQKVYNEGRSCTMEPAYVYMEQA